MLTSVETIPDVTAIEVPPLYDLKPLEAAMRSSHGRYIFSSDNEVLFFHDKEKTTEYVHLYAMCLQGCSRLNSVVVRQEVGPRSVKIGQIVRIKTRFRLLKQENGNFTFRELLKGIYILDDGVCKVCYPSYCLAKEMTEDIRNRSLLENRLRGAWVGSRRRDVM